MQDDGIFQTVAKRAPFIETGQRKRLKNHVTLTRKLHWKSCPTTHSYFLQNNFTILRLLAKTFSPEMKPSECLTKEKNGKRKAKEADRRESKRQKSRDQWNFFSKFCLLRTSKAGIWHQKQKLAFWPTCKQYLDSVSSFWLRNDQKMAPLASKGVLLHLLSFQVSKY